MPLSILVYIKIFFFRTYVTGEKRRDTKKGRAREQDDRDIGKLEDAIIG